MEVGMSVGFDIFPRYTGNYCFVYDLICMILDKFWKILLFWK